MRIALDTNRYTDLCRGEWIAALVLQHDLTLLARDRQFDALPQLRRA